MSHTVITGAVLYDPKVSVIWDTIARFFDSQGVPMDVVFYTNYALQSKALAEGHLDIAWNSPLAWLESQRLTNNGCRAIAMRDTDRDRCTHFVVRKDGPKSLAELKGATIALGAQDSPQATLIPLGHLLKNGLEPGRDVSVKRFDLLVGKHGDHIGGELEAFRCLQKGEAQASAMLDLNWQTWTGDGTFSPEEFRILETTPNFDHCVFTVRDDFPREIETKWLKALFAMSYDNPDHREMMDLEGLKKWEPGRTSGFGPLDHAVRSLGFFEGDFR